MIERLYRESGEVEVSRDFSTTRRLEYDEACFGPEIYLKKRKETRRALGLDEPDLRDLALIIAVKDIIQRLRGATREEHGVDGSLPLTLVSLKNSSIELYRTVT